MTMDNALLTISLVLILTGAILGVITAILAIAIYSIYQNSVPNGLP